MTATFRADIRRFMLAVLVGLGLFAIAIFIIAGGTSPAGAVESAVLTLTETRWGPLALIGGMFSLFLAFNLALYRQTCRIYARQKPRRRSSRTA